MSFKMYQWLKRLWLRSRHMLIKSNEHLLCCSRALDWAAHGWCQIITGSASAEKSASDRRLIHYLYWSKTNSISLDLIWICSVCCSETSYLIQFPSTIWAQLIQDLLQADGLRSCGNDCFFKSWKWPARKKTSLRSSLHQGHKIE